MVIQNELTSGHKETIIKFKNTSVILTANAMARSTEEAFMYVNDSDVFVFVVLEDLLTVLFLGLLFEDVDYTVD